MASQSPPLRLVLQPSLPIERELSWEDPEVCESPLALLMFLVKNVSVDAEQLDAIGESVVFQANQPSTDNTKKIWVKTSAPYGIGYFSGGKWRVSYEYSPHAIHEFPEGVEIPSYMSQLSKADATARGLDSSYRWAVLRV